MSQGHAVRYADSDGSNGRVYSPDLWRDCPLLDIMLGEADGHYFVDDFVDLPTGRYTATQATAGTFALGDAPGGVALADCNSTTVTQGINVQLGSTVGESFIPVAGSKIWAEARLKATDIATGPEFYMGLAVIDTTIIGSSALSAQAIGFKSVTDDGVLLATCKGASSETTAASNTLVEDTYVRLGFRVTETGLVEFYVNGVKNATTIAANLPIVEMVPSLVCQSDGTTDSIIHIDQWRFVQANNVNVG